MRSRAALAGLLAACVVAGASCQAQRPETPRAAAPAPDPFDLARAAVSRGDHATAVALLHDLLPAHPDNLEAHYLLAVSASHLDHHDEASREFQWVVGHGDPGSTEVAIAREWLASRARSIPQSPAPPPVAVVNVAPAQKPELASLSGTALDAGGAKTRLLLFLKGVPGTAVQDESHTLRTDRRGQFHFSNVVPGEYLLTDAVAGPATWRLRLTLTRAERRVIDLSPTNSTSLHGADAGAAR
jgi:hypothetical protein